MLRMMLKMRESACPSPGELRNVFFFISRKSESSTHIPEPREWEIRSDIRISAQRLQSGAVNAEESREGGSLSKRDGVR